ncbi:MAG: MFS transporter [Propionicimonas sp.]|uniref:MFS transporter n=1 Tax=Propionicimonas sp. TaxID=1955623 RepID=UPI003D12F5B2
MTATPSSSLGVGTDPLVPDADAQPTFRNPGSGVVTVIGAASISLMAALLSVGILTMPLKATAIDAQGSTTIIAVANVVAGVIALLLNPVMGRISDRTLGRFGRRRPYVLVGSLLLAVGAFTVLQATGVALVALGWGVMTIGQIAAQAGTFALVPDQFAPERRGVVSGIIGVAGSAGAIVGLFLGSLFSPNLALMIMVPAGLAVLCNLLLVAVVKDDPIRAEDRPALALREAFGTFWVSPRQHPDFALAFSSRFAVFWAIAAVNAYQAVYLIMGLHISPADIAGKMFIANLISGVLAIVFATVLGKVSDKVGRRKPFVVTAAAVFAVGLVLITMATSFEAFLVGVAVMGIGMGVYLAVDFALITQVLPDPKNPAKDIGIMNLASSLPNIVVPAVAPALLALGASTTSPANFTVFFGVAAVAGIIGAILIVPIRRVR